MHIAIDLDDVILDFTGGVRKAVAKEYGVEVPEFTDWDMSKVLNPIIGRSWWSWMKDREWLWSHFDAIDGAMGGIETLRRRGHQLEIVTSKPQWAEHNVWRWLGKWRPAVQSVTIVGEHEPKILATDARLIVDDKVDTCESFVLHGRHAILFGRSHNLTAPRRGDIVRIDNWPDLVDGIGHAITMVNSGVVFGGRV